MKVKLSEDNPGGNSAAVLGLAVSFAFTLTVWGGERRTLYGHVPEVVARLGLQPVGRLPATSAAGALAATGVSIAEALLTGPTPIQLLLADAGGGTNVITYLGTPGANYAFDLATNLMSPIKWMPQGTNTASIGNAATAGYLTLTNSNHVRQAYYRTRSVP